MKQLGKYSFVLIALYIGVNQYTGSGKLISAGANGSSQIIKSFQGR